KPPATTATKSPDRATAAAPPAPPAPPAAPAAPAPNGSSPAKRNVPRGDHPAYTDLSRPLGDRPESQSQSTWEKEAVIELRNVHKAFGQFKVLDGVTCRIPKGEISVLMGPSGTGKSVTLRHIVGLLPPDSGDIFVADRDVPLLNEDELLELRRGIGMLFQDGALFSSMSLYDNVAFPLRQHTKKSEGEIREIVMDRLTEVGMAGAEKRMPNELSGGMRKRAGFARALVMEPKILLFDEPDSGLDPVRTTLLCDLIREISAKYKATSIVVSHDVGAVRRFADNIGILYKGKMRHFGNKKEIEESDDEFVHQFFNASGEGPLGMD
ncbi:MAG TPA: ABC transporter ATP-binding protein, partial [Pedococcus sp.]|nr:ABC transporter ATP-binding protein [Pedococcus sp.]